MTTLSFNEVYHFLGVIANYKVYGVLLCRLVMPVVVVGLFIISRLLSSWALKALAIAIGIVIYNFPTVVSFLAGK